MRRRLLHLACLVPALAACAGGTGGPSDVLPGEQSATATARQFVNAAGTPVHIVLKGASCAGTAVVALPVTSAATIVGDQGLRRDTVRTVDRTCGGAWVLGRD